jgi:hypothetical protein
VEQRLPASGGVDHPGGGDRHSLSLELVGEAKPGGHAAEVRLLLGEHQRHAGAAPSGAGGPADAVNVVLVLGGRVVVDDVGDVLHIQAPRGQIGGDQRGDLPGLESSQGSLPGSLGKIAVHRRGRDPLRLQSDDQPIGPSLGTDEYEG